MNKDVLPNHNQIQELEALQVKNFDELAILHVKDFVTTVHKLLTIDRKNFDLLVGAGNSGVVMVGITKLVYNFCGLVPPPTLMIPIQRYQVGFDGPFFDNSVLLSEVSQTLLGLPGISEVLFVDDETGLGTTVRASLTLVRNALSANMGDRELLCTVVTEDRAKDKDLLRKLETPGTKITLISFPSKTMRHEWRIIAKYFKPEALAELEGALTKKKINGQYAMNIGSGMPVRQYTGPDSQPFFDYRIGEELDCAPSQLEFVQQQLADYLWKLCESATAKENPVLS